MDSLAKRISRKWACLFFREFASVSYGLDNKHWTLDVNLALYANRRWEYAAFIEAGFCYRSQSGPVHSSSVSACHSVTSGSHICRFRIKKKTIVPKSGYFKPSFPCFQMLILVRPRIYPGLTSYLTGKRNAYMHGHLSGQILGCSCGWRRRSRRAPLSGCCWLVAPRWRTRKKA